MLIYVKVAMKVLVDNVAVQAIEACLMARLPELISPASVMQMDDEIIRRIAAESEESQELRRRSLDLFHPKSNIPFAEKNYLHRNQKPTSPSLLENNQADSISTTEQLTRKATVLKAGLEICRRYTGGLRSTTGLGLATLSTPAPRRQTQGAEDEESSEKAEYPSVRSRPRAVASRMTD